MQEDHEKESLFPKKISRKVPVNARWFRHRMRNMRAELMLSIVTILDRQMNNTSLILLFEANGKKLLFPGDAQIENWSYALSQPQSLGISSMLENTQRAYEWDLENRRLVGVPMQGTEIVSSEIRPGVFFDKDGLKLTAFEVEHMPINVNTGERIKMAGQTLCYRVDYKARSVVFSGDTRPSEELILHAQNVDVLIHETQVPSAGNSKEAILANVSLSVHTTPEQASEIFNQTLPRMAVYSHIIPPNTTKEQLVKETRPIYKGPASM